MKHFTLLKFGAKEHMDSLLKKGTIYCNTCHYFATLKDGNSRGDIYENVNAMYEIIKIELANLKTKKSISFNEPKGQLLQSTSPELSSGNLYCLYTYDFLTNFSGDDIIHHFNVNCEIDRYFIIIKDCPEFLRRIQEKLKYQGLEFSCGLVQYKDLTKYTGSKTPFMKDLTYQNQKEYRFYIKNPVNETLCFNIGSIEDIAILYPANHLSKIVWRAKGIYPSV